MRGGIQKGTANQASKKKRNCSTVMACIQAQEGMWNSQSHKNSFCSDHNPCYQKWALWCLLWLRSLADNCNGLVTLSCSSWDFQRQINFEFVGYYTMYHDTSLFSFYLDWNCSCNLKPVVIMVMRPVN
jgi:hypothetical protein